MTEPATALPRRLAYVPLESIRPAENNGGRIHDLPAIRTSLSLLGFADPLKEDERTGRLVGGHGTVEALVEMMEDGEPPPEGVIIDDDGGWLVPVFTGWRSKDDGSASALLLGLNRIPGNARYTDYGLASLLEEVATDHAELLDATGFPAESIDELLRYVTPERLNEADPDDPFALAGKPEHVVETPTGDGTGTPDILDSHRPPLITCPECAAEFTHPATLAASN